MWDIWDRIEDWSRANAPRVHASFCPGATLESVIETEKFLGVTFPRDVRDSYLIHDGQTEDGVGFIDGWDFLSLERIRREWQVWKTLLDGGHFEGYSSLPDEGIRSEWWNDGWVPLTCKGAGDNHCLDLNPEDGGEPGQILLMWHDDAVRTRIAGSFRVRRRQFADDLEAGRYVYPEDDVGSVRKDELGGRVPAGSSRS